MKEDWKEYNYVTGESQRNASKSSFFLGNFGLYKNNLIVAHWE